MGTFLALDSLRADGTFGTGNAWGTLLALNTLVPAVAFQALFALGTFLALDSLRADGTGRA